MRPLMFDAPIIPHHQRPEGCIGCPFGGIKVGSRGPEDSPFVIVGEAPGSQELWRGYPFTGPGGRLLTETLAKVGLPENIEPLYINAIQCFPRTRKEELMPQAISLCHNRLIEIIKKHPRKIILSLGSAAAVSLTGIPNIKITQVRGQVKSFQGSAQGIVLTVHPAYLMRQGSVFNDWQRDLQKAVNLFLNGASESWQPPTWQVISTKPEYAAMIGRALKAEYIAADIETSGFDYQRDYMISNGITLDGKHVYIIPNKILWGFESLTKRLMESAGPKWIWQNGKFDVRFFRGEGIKARVDEDTMLQSYALDEQRGKHDLDQIAFRELDAPNHKKVLDQYLAGFKKADRSYAKVPRDVLYQYQAYDIAKTYQMFFAMRPQIMADAHLNKLYHKVLIPASECLTEVELEGIKLDPEQVLINLEQCDKELNGAIEEIMPYVYKHMGDAAINFNIASPAQLGNLLYKQMKLGTPGSSTDKQAIINIQRRYDHPIIIPIQKYRKIAKRKSTYVMPAIGLKLIKGKYVKTSQGWVGADDKVHTSFKLPGSTTGRLASADPNMQNMERGPFIRRQFIADEGEWLVECDLNQAELRSLAIMSGDPTLLRIYTENITSIHKVTAEAFFGIDYNHDQYMRAKAVNFGIVYGRTAYTLAQEFDISLKEAQFYIDTWFARYPVAHAFINRCREAPLNQQVIITNFGRKKRWGVVSQDNLHDLQNEAANYPHQSTASDITLVAATEAGPILKERWNARICNLVHDAIYFKIRQDKVALDESVTYLMAVMERVPRDWGLTKVPFIADAKYGERWDEDSMHKWSLAA